MRSFCSAFCSLAPRITTASTLPPPEPAFAELLTDASLPIALAPSSTAPLSPLHVLASTSSSPSVYPRLGLVSVVTSAQRTSTRYHPY